MSSILIRNATIVNEGKTFSDLLIKDEIISAVGPAGQLDSQKILRLLMLQVYS